MDERTMFELLEMYDAKEALIQVLDMLIGDRYEAGYGEGIIGNLSYAYDIIARNSPLRESGRNVEDTLFGQILDNKAIDNHKKARLLLGLDI